MRISAIMPAYNEEANIDNVVKACFRELGKLCDEVEVVVTNDGSIDGTSAILSGLQTELQGLKVINSQPNQGYGAALYKAIQASSGDLVVSLDSDGQFDISDVASLLPQFDDSLDILTGYRKSKKDSMTRVMADRIMNWLIRVLFRVPFKDTNCALKLYRGNRIRSLPLEATGFQIPTEIILKSFAMGFKIREAPVNHNPRTGGTSALAPFNTAFAMFTFLLYLRMKISLFSRRIIRSL